MNKLIFALMASAAISTAALAQQQTPSQPPARDQVAPPQQMQPSQRGQPGQMPQDRSGMPQREMSPRALGPQRVRQIQQALNQRGMNLQVDGIWGPQTQSAVRDFQQQQGIAPTGRPDSRTLSALGVGMSPPPGQQPPAVRPGAPPSSQQQPNVPQPRQRQY